MPQVPWVIRQAINHPMATVVGYAAFTGVMIGNPATRALGWQMGSFGLRAAGNVSFGAARGLFGTTLVRGGTVTLGSTAMVGTASVGLGYMIGATVGTGIAYAWKGDEGAKDALYFYSNPYRATKELFEKF